MSTIDDPRVRSGPDPRLVAIHVLRALRSTTYERCHRTLDDLALVIGARRSDVRRALSALHREGFVDVLRMRLTLAGFALTHALGAVRLRAVRQRRPAHHECAA